jgi:hypothetical protein
MEYYLLNTTRTDEYQHMGFVNGLPLEKDGKPDTLKWGHPQGRIIDVGNIPQVKIIKSTLSKKRPDVFFFGGLQIVINEKTKKVMEKIISHDICQFFTLELINKNNFREYVYILNPLYIANCINKELSKYKRRAIFNYIIAPVLEEKEIPEVPIFIILECPVLTIVNEKLYNLLKKEEIIGFEFEKISIINSEKTNTKENPVNIIYPDSLSFSNS